jgi:hypothetical protein
LEYFGFVQKNYQPHYFEVSEPSNCGELLSESATQHGPLYFPWEIAWVLVGCSGGCLVAVQIRQAMVNLE